MRSSLNRCRRPSICCCCLETRWSLHFLRGLSIQCSQLSGGMSNLCLCIAQGQISLNLQCVCWSGSLLCRSSSIISCLLDRHICVESQQLRINLTQISPFLDTIRHSRCQHRNNSHQNLHYSCRHNFFQAFGLCTMQHCMSMTPNQR